jgi:hypothetical protein
VHAHVRDRQSGHQRQHVGISLTARHVVDQPSAAVDGFGRHRRAHRVNADHGSGRRQLTDHREHATHFLSNLRPGGAGARRLATDVDQVGAFLDEF